MIIVITPLIIALIYHILIGAKQKVKISEYENLLEQFCILAEQQKENYSKNMQSKIELLKQSQDLTWKQFFFNETHKN